MGDSYAYPSVFVVDGRTDTVPFATSAKQKNLTFTHKFLLMLVLLALIGDGLGAFYLWRLRSDVQQFSSMFLAAKNTSLMVGSIQGCNCSAYEYGRLQWAHNRGIAFLRGIDYKEGALVIKKSGHYFIYSKILLGEISCNDDKNGFLKQTVFKEGAAYPQPIELMAVRKFFCTGENPDHWLDNSYLGAIFDFNEGDHVFIKITDKKLLRISNDAETFFGAFMI
ncbi:tumor necrosis factor ligand superfamily member 14-like isoform X2 [Carcharodon carcharias]|uniref:tumor necrosis factor ligand superfamily member 14-like isoform X2 n=1 Tax=Carcharodon carcharias TaxID=13397 RepID=UPI001B7E162E|nr:tumor necrosis factor ligand superfamily member 14-like isoform X2 [Carcharodon carcharias]